MDDLPYKSILKRVGVVLLAVGILDIGWMIYTIARGRSYSSSLNIFAVVAGILLMRGGLKTAGVVRWFGIFMLTALVGVLLALPLLQPIRFTMMEVRSAGTGIVGSLAIAVLLLGVLYWIAKELGREPVLAARPAANIKRRDMRVPAACGVLLAVVAGVGAKWMQGLDSAQQAIKRAKEEVGPGYSFHVQSLNIVQTADTKAVRALVTAWNDSEIREVPVAWQEARK